MKILRVSCAIFLMATALPLYASQSSAASSQNHWTAANDSIQISVDKSTGVIDRLVDQVSHEDYCNQVLADATSDTDGNRGLTFTVGKRIGGLTLYDELRNRLFRDISDPASHAPEAIEDGGVDILSFDKQYPDAEFVVHETFLVGPKDVRWNVRIRRRPDRIAPSASSTMFRCPWAGRHGLPFPTRHFASSRGCRSPSIMANPPLARLAKANGGPPFR